MKPRSASSTIARMSASRSTSAPIPSPGRRRRCAPRWRRAPVGDDQYGEDPLTNELQARVAALLGKEQGLWLPSGTMANQVALRVLTRPGDEVVVSREAHAGWHETGGSAANAGVQLVEVGARGVFDVAALEAAIKPRGLPVYPPTTLVEIENTHNRSGGIVFAQDEVVRICALARSRGIATFLDGARLWNASVASGIAAGRARRAVRPGRGLVLERPRRARRVAARRLARR